MSEERMREELTEDIFSLSKEYQFRYCDCISIAQELIKLGWEKKLNDESQKEI